jgi:hypothetical protein
LNFLGRRGCRRRGGLRWWWFWNLELLEFICGGGEGRTCLSSGGITVLLASPFLDIPSNSCISLFSTPLLSKKAIFLSVGASFTSSSSRNFFACSSFVAGLVLESTCDLSSSRMGFCAGARCQDGTPVFLSSGSDSLILKSFEEVVMLSGAFCVGLSSAAGFTCRGWGNVADVTKYQRPIGSKFSSTILLTASQEVCRQSRLILVRELSYRPKAQLTCRLLFLILIIPIPSLSLSLSDTTN